MKYYFRGSFLRVDLLFHFFYLTSSPFRISKRYMQKRGAKDIHVYGETPLSTWAMIAKECCVLPTDVVYDLGCGRGRGVCWLAMEIGCKAIGIEIIEEFVRKARVIAKLGACKRASFKAEDMTRADFSDASVIYLYALFMSEESEKRLISILSQLKKGTRIISVGEKLPFKCIKEFEGRYPWGKTTLYLQIL